MPNEVEEVDFETVNFRCQPDEKTRLEAIARTMDRSLSSLLRLIVHRYLEEKT